MTIQGSIDRVQRNEAGISAVLERLSERFGNRFSRSEAVRQQHGHTLTWLENQWPDGVVYAVSTEDVADIVNLCREHRVPIIPFGAGSSLEGHVNAPGGGISIDFSRMDQVLEVHHGDLDVVVQPGITHQALNAYLRDYGMFFPIDPGAEASIGGMAATRASGTNAVRYGTMRDNVLNLTAVMPDGSVVKTGHRARKSSAGYDLTRLLIGSEGTLGVITELTLRLQGIPEAIAGGICPFETVHGACDAVIETIQMGIPVARIELLDPLQVKACNAYSKLDLPEVPTLFLEFHGTEAGVKEQSELFGEIAAEHGAGEFVWETTPEARNRLWKARHDVYWAVAGLRPGARPIATDACVPISRLADCVTETIADIEESNLVAPIVGHVGDGNFHVSLVVDMEDASEVERAADLIGRLAVRAISMDGTCTGEHGVGQGKMKYLEAEHGPGLDVMRTIKRAIDPLNIMNPGKIVAMD